MERWILGVDIGTTSLKAAVFDERGAQLACAIEEYALSTPSPSFVEAPCKVYIASMCKCLAAMSAKINLNNVAVMGFSVQGETLTFLDGAGEPVCDAIVWMDNRAAREAELLREKFGDENCYRVTGQVSFEACWPAAKVLWLRRNRPELFTRIRHILLLEDYILYRLTGKFVSECSLLSSTEYWEIRSKRYWPEMLDFLGVPEEWLPEIRESGEMVGGLLPDIARELGLPEGVSVCTGCLDQVAGAIGVGNIRPGILSENIGAALAICVPTRELTYDPNRQMPVHYFALPDTYMMHTFTTGGMCLRWFRDVFCQAEMEVGKATGFDTYALMDREALRIPPGCEGLVTLPHLQGSMAPDVNLSARGVFFGATLAHGRGHFIRSVMESLGFIVRRNLEAINAMGLAVDEIRTLGGGSKSDAWNQIKADITGRTLKITQSSQDTACLGAAILAGVAAGMFKSVESACASMVKIRRAYTPDPSLQEVYAHGYGQYKALFAALEPVFVHAADQEN